MIVRKSTIILQETNGSKTTYFQTTEALDLVQVCKILLFDPDKRVQRGNL